LLLLKILLTLFINAIRDHYEHAISHTFLRPGEYYFSRLTLTFFVLYLIDPHVIMSKPDSFPSLSSYKSTDEKKKASSIWRLG